MKLVCVLLQIIVLIRFSSSSDKKEELEVTDAVGSLNIFIKLIDDVKIF
jgi:hypothetical protein